MDDRSVSFQISPIEKRHHGGKLLGYNITYSPVGDPNNMRFMLVDENTRRVTLNSLTHGPTYVILAAGFTSAGVGSKRLYAATCKLFLLMWQRIYHCNRRKQFVLRIKFLQGDFCNRVQLTMISILDGTTEVGQNYLFKLHTAMWFGFRCLLMAQVIEMALYHALIDRICQSRALEATAVGERGNFKLRTEFSHHC